MALLRKLFVSALCLVMLTTGQSLGADAQASDPPTYEETINRPDLHRGHNDVLRLYWAYFARQPDASGADYWITAYDSCEWGPSRISQFFSVSPEFVETYGSQTDADFIDLIYENVLGRPADAGGSSYWLERLSAGETRGSIVTDFAFSYEFRELHPLPSDEVANTGCVGARALRFFQSTEPICQTHADRVGNPAPSAARFSGAIVADVRSVTAVVIEDGVGDRLVVDFAFDLTEPARFGSVEPTVIYPAEDPEAVLPIAYSFGCPETLYLGSAHD